MSSKKDIKYLGVPNVCFSITDKKDKREKEYSKQRIERGFDDSELWNLDMTISKFIVPRLEAYIEYAGNIIDQNEDTRMKINSLLEALKLISDQKNLYPSDEEKEKIKKGLSYFNQVFERLWV